MEKVIIIDAASLINRYYHASIASGKKETGNPDYMPTPNASGYYSNALEPFVLKLLSLQKMGYTSICVCFDRARDLLNRRDVFPDYKANRDETPLPLRQQLDNAPYIVQQMGLKFYFAEGIEADDFAGTLTKIFTRQPDKYVDIMTCDHDYFQLACRNPGTCSQSNILMLVDEKKREAFGYDETVPSSCIRYEVRDVINETGLKPRQIIDLKAIIGDKSDNYPGIPKVGEKAAVPLLQHYKSLEAIYADIDAKNNEELKELWKSIGVARPNPQAFRENRDIAFLCKQIATIDLNVDAAPFHTYKDCDRRAPLTDEQKAQIAMIDADTTHYPFLIDTDKLIELCTLFSIDLNRNYERPEETPDFVNY